MCRVAPKMGTISRNASDSLRAHEGTGSSPGLQTVGDAQAAARSALDSSLLMGFDVLCDGQITFIHCARDLLLKDGITLRPAEQTVAEVLEEVPSDDLAVAACERLRSGGYLIALDDFVANDPRAPLTGLVDRIKVDFERTTPADRPQLVRRYSRPCCHLFAQEVETRDPITAKPRVGESARGEMWWQAIEGGAR